MKIPRLLAMTAALTLFARFVAAQDVTFDVNGTYSAGTTRSMLTAPDAPFVLELTVPETVTLFSPANEPSHLLVPTLGGFYRFAGQTYPSTSGDISFDETTMGSRTSIDLNTPAGSLFFQTTPPGFTSTFADFATGNTANSVDVTFLTGNRGAIAFDGVPNASVVGTLSPVPEPSCLALAAAGLLSLCGVAFMRQNRNRLIPAR